MPGYSELILLESYALQEKMVSHLIHYWKQHTQLFFANSTKGAPLATSTSAT